MDRRSLLKGTIAAGATLALLGRTFAQPAPGPRDRQLLALAKAEVERAGDVLWARDLVGIADYGMHSAEPRFHFVNLDSGTVESVLVSHGTGSDPEHDGWLNSYSNVEGSNATSRGAYITWEWYTGRYGTSVRLGGLDPSNDQAFPRAIVMHQAKYAEPEHVERWGRLGRSNGCFAFGQKDFRTALMRLSGGRLLFADSLGIAADGTQVERPAPADLELLQPENPRGTEQMLPGVF